MKFPEHGQNFGGLLLGDHKGRDDRNNAVSNREYIEKDGAKGGVVAVHGQCLNSGCAPRLIFIQLSLADC